jgi:hypothetical protein
MLSTKGISAGSLDVVSPGPSGGFSVEFSEHPLLIIIKQKINSLNNIIKCNFIILITSLNGKFNIWKGKKARCYAL